MKTPNALADHARHGGEGRAHLREAGVRRCIRLQAEMEKRSEREEAELGPGEAWCRGKTIRNCCWRTYLLDPKTFEEILV